MIAEILPLVQCGQNYSGSSRYMAAASSLRTASATAGTYTASVRWPKAMRSPSPGFTS